MSEMILEKNLSAMGKWYPAFVELIRNADSDQVDDIDIMVEQSWDGEIIFRVQKDGEKLYLNGKRNARKAIDVWMDNLGKINKLSPVFLFGIGSGLYLKKIIQETDESVNVVVYEPSVVIFMTALREVDLSEEIENRPIAFVVEGINESEFENVMNKILVLENVEFLKESIHPNYKKLYLEDILKYVKPLQKRVEEMMVNYNTGVKHASGIPINVLNNMIYVCEGYNTKELANVLPHDRAAILVSAGPSLSKNIGLLKRAKNQLFILAVDTAVRPLMNAGIVPDAFCTIDAKKSINLSDIEHIEEIPVIAPCVASHRILENQVGKRIFYDDSYAIARKIYEINGMEYPYVCMGGSVACAGFSALYKMGYKTIILVGQDLAYTNNKSHADGTFAEKMPEEDTKCMMQVKGNYDKTVPTRADLKIFLNWFNDYIQGAKKYTSDFRVINATEGGAYIEGTELMTLERALDEECRKISSVDFALRIDGMQSSFDQEQRKRAADYLLTVPDNFAKIARAARMLKSAYLKIEKMANEGNAGKDGCLKQLRKTKKITKKIMLMPEYQLIDMTMAVADYVLRSEYFYEEENVNKEIAEMGRKGVLYSQLLEECASLLKHASELAFSENHIRHIIEGK